MASSFQNMSARIASGLLHPVFLPSLFLLVWYPLNVDYLPVHLWTLVCLVLFPGIASILWLKIKKEPDLFVVERKNRLVPVASFLIGSIILPIVIGVSMPGNADFPVHLLQMTFSLSLISLLVTAVWKISLHAIGWGATCGAVATTQLHFLVSETAVYGDLGNVLPLWMLGAAILGSLIVFWARYRLGSHGWRQLFAGWWLGFGLPALAGWFFMEIPWIYWYR